MLRCFHLSREFRLQYDAEAKAVGCSDRAILPDGRSANELAFQINRQRNIAVNPHLAVSAAELSALSLLDEIYFYLLEVYQQQYGNNIFNDAYARAQAQLGKDKLSSIMQTFCTTNPPLPVYKGTSNPDDFLRQHGTLLFKELMLVQIEQQNPALIDYEDIFSLNEARKKCQLDGLLELFNQIFDELPGFGPDDEHLMKFLHSPSIAHPDSLFDQLSYIRSHWSMLLGDLLDRLLRTLDRLNEEYKHRGFTGGGNSNTLSFD
ncbi:MAG: alpha-amylase, partial [Spirochaetaceae bacterium]